jgi:hypothetical protein
LPFSDLYIRVNDPSVPARFRADPTKVGIQGNIEDPPAFDEEVGQIRDMVARLLDENGTLTYKGLRLRYVRFFADGGEEWAALRGFPLDLPSLENLGM